MARLLKTKLMSQGQNNFIFKIRAGANSWTTAGFHHETHTYPQLYKLNLNFLPVLLNLGFTNFFSPFSLWQLHGSPSKDAAAFPTACHRSC